MYPVKEMVLGTREQFNYVKCEPCSCVQLAEIPKNISDYYPPEYHSLGTIEASSNFSDFKRKLIIKRDLHSLGLKRSVIGAFLQTIFPLHVESSQAIHRFMYSILMDRVTSKVHDIGCGNATALRYFGRLGFPGLSGNDPHIETDTKVNGVEIRKCEFSSISGTFDGIMLNHVIEHVPDPISLLKQIHLKLNQGGKILLRTPLVDSYGFNEYKQFWSGYDAPRHLHIFNRKGMEKLICSCGFVPEEFYRDSVGWNYSVSEGFRSNKTLNEQTGKESKYEVLADQLNKADVGDTGVFIFSKK